MIKMELASDTGQGTQDDGVHDGEERGRLAAMQTEKSKKHGEGKAFVAPIKNGRPYFKSRRNAIHEWRASVAGEV